MTDYSFYMEKALKLAERALSANEFPVGCVIVHQHEVVAVGVRTGSSGKRPNEIDHAEIAALRALYQLPFNLERKELTLFSSLEPCMMCYGAILLSGIQTIVYAYEDVMGGGTGCDLTTLGPLYRQRTVRIVKHVMRQQSLQLMQDFFSSPDNKYWQDSYLARYTLAQSPIKIQY